MKPRQWHIVCPQCGSPMKVVRTIVTRHEKEIRIIRYRKCGNCQAKEKSIENIRSKR
ncbi:MAG: hypothetical protein Q4D62_16035 [Planctomycetia bacterium]|nr:hypothetical protein [Planctomycetia bacterium]